jgi:spore maturation protein A
MLGKIFGVMAVLSFIFAVFTGRIEAVGIAVAEGSGTAVQLVISLAGMMCLWSGIIRVLKAAGLMELLTRIISPVLKIILPQAYKLKKQGNTQEKLADSALQSVSANIGANILGLGNAATPLGIDAMKKLNSLKTSSGDMIMFVVLNCASLQLIPTTLIALRSAAGSANIFEIMPAVWICSLATTVFAVLITKILLKFSGRKS